ncbi:hypothetical protein EB796_006794 [Bugula neritina]|uniref:Nuclear RNA export factor Tap RNA-binding domain-containing protein n=1 Tax=Bugula neritina TaxID=10212 RepID=A0A7J7K8D3_BUGNE|nr:hypothetical protein EB796_006794 [Bugula neritina]
MDDQYDRQSYGGKGPRTISYRARGRGRGRGGFRNNYSQHDDRDNRTLTERLGERMGYRGRGRDKKGRRGGYIAQRHQDQGHSKQVNGPQWYQVTIPYGTQAGKDFIYESINELLDIPFQPISYKEEERPPCSTWSCLSRQSRH